MMVVNLTGIQMALNLAKPHGQCKSAFFLNLADRMIAPRVVTQPATEIKQYLFIGPLKSEPRHYQKNKVKLHDSQYQISLDDCLISVDVP